MTIREWLIKQAVRNNVMFRENGKTHDGYTSDQHKALDWVFRYPNFNTDDGPTGVWNKARIYYANLSALAFTRITNEIERQTEQIFAEQDKLRDFARAMSIKTNPYQSGNYFGDVSSNEWTNNLVFTLYTYAYNVADALEQSNYETIKKRLSEFDNWQDERIASWLTPFYRITIYPFGTEFDQPFDAALVATCQDIINELEDYPSLNDERWSEIESEEFESALEFEMRDYGPEEDNHPLWAIVREAFDHSSGDYDHFLCCKLRSVIKEYEDSQE